jgi:hypothetical protein
MQAENCQPPLGISDEARDYLAGLKEGERVIECGQSGIAGHLGTVYISDRSGTPTVCVRWDKRPGETGSMGTSATWGTRRLKDAGTFSNADDGFDDDGPYYSDGCDSDGFKGGCERAGHTPETCPSNKGQGGPVDRHGCNQTGQPNGTCLGFQIGDTIMFADRHIAAGDYGVIVAEEVWLNPDKTMAWDGVGERPAYDYGCYQELHPPSPRFLVRLESHNPKSNDAIGGLKSWRERCVQWPHDYPFVTPIDMKLVSRPSVKRLNDTNCLGSVVGMDARQSLSCISDSEAGVCKTMADMKASACLRLNRPKSDSESRILSFSCEEVTETKVADQISIGFRFWAQTIFGIRAAEVIAIDDAAGSADTKVGGHQGFLKRKDDGWYDQHTVGNPDSIAKVQFTL